MIYFLYGQDTYRSRQKLNEIIEQYKKIHKSGLNLKYFDGQNLDFQGFIDEIQSLSMFEEKKLMVLKNSFSNLDFKEKFLKNSERFSDSKNIILFYEQNKILGSDPLFKFLEKNAESQEFKLLEGVQLKNWVKKEFAKYKCKIEEKSLETLIEFIGNDLWRFSNEIMKLATFKSDMVKEDKSSFPPALSLRESLVKEADIELFVKPKIETDIFETIDYLGSKNKKRALELIKKHLEKGDHPLYLLSMINYQFRNLLMIKSSESGYDFSYNDIRALADRLEMHPYVVRKTIQQAKKFTLEELKKIYRKIFDLDLAVKTGKIEIKTALDLFIVDI